VRFRKVSTRYARCVAEAYEGDLERAMADTDEQVAATVAAWEQAHGLPVRDWPAIGREERDEEPGGVADVSSLLRQVQPAIARHTEAYAKLVEVAQTLDAHAAELLRFKEWRKTHAEAKGPASKGARS
jgi:hypothetical protein